MRQNNTLENTQQAGIAALSLILMVLLLIAVASAAVAGTYFYTRHAGSAAMAQTKPEPLPKPTFVKLDPFTVNLAGDSGRVLYIGLSLEVAGKNTADRLKTRLPQIRDRILMTLTGQNAHTLTTVQGKKKLATTLREALRKPYVEHGQTLSVKRVLFTNFIVQ